MPESLFILTIDIGTSSSRAMLFDAQGRPAPGCLAQVTYQPRTTPDGGVEFDPLELFGAVVSVIDRLLAQAGPRAGQIGGVALDMLVTNIMGLDAAGRPVTPLYTYADTRDAPDAHQLRQELGADGQAAAHNRTGCLVHAAYLPARFRWLARTRPELLERASHWASIGEYLLWRFLGRWQVSYSAAAWTGLLNRQSLAWDDAWLARLPIAANQLSPLVDVDQPLAGLRDEWAGRWPALRDVPWYPPIGDGAAANIGSGCGDPSRLALTIGTSGAMRAVLPPQLETVPPGLWLYRVSAARGLLGGATTEGGNVFAWLRERLQLPPAAELEAALGAMAPAAHGLTILPFFGGERAPGWQEQARASIVGLSLHTRPLDIVRAGLESVAFRFGLIYRRIAPHLPGTDHRLTASGGILNSPAWLQIMADVLGRPIQTLAEKEGASRGAALLALESLGVIADATVLPPELGPVYEPNPRHHAIYQAAIERQEEVYRQLVGA